MSMLNVSRRKGPAIITKWHEDMGPKIELKDWMKGHPDSKKLNKMTIPGTHNTMSYNTLKVANHWVWCQCFDLRYQLDIGVRFLDIRCRFTDNKMNIYHGKYSLDTTLPDVLQICRDFLDEFPSECIILSLQHEMQEKDKIENWVNLFLDHLEENILNTEKIWRECRVPTLGEVRGKMVVLANYPSYPSRQLTWGKNMIVENTWSPGGQENKMKKVINNLSRAKKNNNEMDDEWYLTFCSYSDNQFPCNTADDMNYDLLKYARRNFGKFKNGAGCIVVDYPGYSMIEDIINLSSSDPWKCPIGWETSTNLTILPAIALNTEFGEVPGKTIDCGDKCWYGYDGAECETDDYKIVGGDVKPIATTCSGDEVRMGIAKTKYGWTPCKISGEGDVCWYTFDGKEYKQKSNFDVIEHPDECEEQVGQQETEAEDGEEVGHPIYQEGGDGAEEILGADKIVEEAGGDTNEEGDVVVGA